MWFLHEKGKLEIDLRIRLTLSHRVAHDEISPSREGVHSAGVHHHLICLTVHNIAGSHWVIMLVSAACLVEDTGKCCFGCTF